MPGSPKDPLAGVTALSLDAYGTLFDLEVMGRAVIDNVCALGGAPGDMAIWREVSLDIFAQFRELEAGAAAALSGAAAGAIFLPMRERFRTAYARVLPRHGLGEVDPARASAYVLAAHARTPLYPDVRPFLDAVTPAFDLGLSSDADNDFLSEAVERAGLGPYFGAVLTSETLRTYKAEPGGRFFEAVAAVLGRSPAEIAHIGDGQSDVVGASRAGFRAVWLCRDGRPWLRDDVVPDLVVHSLTDLAQRLSREHEAIPRILGAGSDKIVL